MGGDGKDKIEKGFVPPKKPPVPPKKPPVPGRAEDPKKFEEAGFVPPPTPPQSPGQEKPSDQDSQGGEKK